MKKTIKLILALLFISCFINSYGQKLVTTGTDFIFPNLQARGLNIETFNSPATVTIKDNGTLSTQILNLPADTCVNLALMPFTSTTYSRMTIDNYSAQNTTTQITSTSTIAVKYRSADGAAGGMGTIFPVKSGGDNFTVSTHHIEYFINQNFHNMTPNLIITATENNTQVTITPSHNTDNGWLAGSVNTITLNKGQAYPVQGIYCAYFANTFYPACFPAQQYTLNDLSGTHIKTDSCKKLNVSLYMRGGYFGGGKYVPSSCCSESLIEMYMPTKYFGKTYYVVPQQHVVQGDLIKIFSAQNNTQIFINNTYIKTLNKNETLDTVFTTPSKIESNQKFHVSQYYLSAGNVRRTAPYDTTDPEVLFTYPIDYRTDRFNFTSKVWAYPSPNPYSNHLTILTETTNTSNLTLDGNAIPSTRFQNFIANPNLSYAYFNVSPGFHRLKATSGTFQAIINTNQTQGSGAVYSSFDTTVYIKKLPYMNDTCVLDTISLFGDTNYEKFLWSTGDTTLSIRVNSPGIYWVKSFTCTDTITDTFDLDGSVYSFKTAKICSGGVINFGGIAITTPGIYKDTINNLVGCDSILTLTVKLEGPDTNTLNQIICLGDTFVFNNIPYFTSGTYIDTFKNIYGCDSMVTTLNINTSTPILISTISDTICENDSISFNGTMIYSAGIYYDTLKGIGNCDSIQYSFNLTVFKKISITINETICNDTIYNFNGTILNTTGTYIDTISSGIGCDSIITLNLSVNPMYYLLVDTQFCLHDSIFIINKIINSEGSNYFTYTNQYNCDSIIEYNVTEICPNNLFIPNTFTPDKDGINEVFKPVFVEELDYYEFLIFNRWGELIFETKDIATGWDGKHKGLASQTDSYIWKIKYTINGEIKSIIGHVHLLR